VCEIVYGSNATRGKKSLSMAAARLSSVLSAYVARWSFGGRPFEVDENYDKGVVALALHYLALKNGKEPSRIAQPLTSNWLKHARGCKPEDAKFIDEVWEGADGKSMVCALIKVADYLGIESLLHLGCAKVASVIKDVSLADIESILRGSTRHRSWSSVDRPASSRTEEEKDGPPSKRPKVEHYRRPCSWCLLKRRS